MWGQNLSSFCLAAACCFCLSKNLSAETATVAKDQAQVWVGKKLVDKLAKGQFLNITARHGNWCGVSYQTADGKKSGWVHKSSLVAESKITSKLPARISQKTLQRLKSATVFIELKLVAGRATYSTGFLVCSGQGAGLIVTTASMLRFGKEPLRVVTVFFNSGSPRERSARAKIVTEDPSRDIAVLKVKMKNLPKPISLFASAALQETLPVTLLGFPLGRNLAATGKNPAVTVSQGTVSSIRKDDFGAIDFIQLDADISPGSAGGPIVDSSDALVAIAVAKLPGTQISVGLHPAEVSEPCPWGIGKSSI